MHRRDEPRHASHQQVLDNGKLRVEQVELYANDDAEDVARLALHTEDCQTKDS